MKLKWGCTNAPIYKHHNKPTENPHITIGVGRSALVDPKVAHSLFAAESIKQSEQHEHSCWIGEFPVTLFLAFVVEETVAPIQKSSSPPRSPSDTASKAVSPPCASPPSHISGENCYILLLLFFLEILGKKNIWNPVFAHFSGAVRDYILEAKAHMSQTCEDIEVGLTLGSHYVDVQVSQREIVYRCGRNAHKAQDKELVFTSDTHRQKSLLGLNQVTFLVVESFS